MQQKNKNPPVGRINVIREQVTEINLNQEREREKGQKAPLLIEAFRGTLVLNSLTLDMISTGASNSFIPFSLVHALDLKVTQMDEIKVLKTAEKDLLLADNVTPTFETAVAKASTVTADQSTPGARFPAREGRPVSTVSTIRYPIN